jgi:hypothetical protein
MELFVILAGLLTHNAQLSFKRGKEYIVRFLKYCIVHLQCIKRAVRKKI